MPNVPSLSLISVRLSHRCLSAATKVDIEQPMARVVCLVIRRDTSLARRSSKIASSSVDPPGLGLSAGQPDTPACAIVCSAGPAFPNKVDVTLHGLVQRTDFFKDDDVPRER